jgi:hypothetical protein
MGRYHHILHVAFGVRNKLMEFLLGLVDTLLVLPGDVYFIFPSAMRPRWDVAIDLWKGWGEIDGGV